MTENSKKYAFQRKSDSELLLMSSLCEENYLSKPNIPQNLPIVKSHLSSTKFDPLLKKGIIAASIASHKKHFYLERIRPEFHAISFTRSGKGTVSFLQKKINMKKDMHFIYTASSRAVYESFSKWNVCWFMFDKNSFWNSLMPNAPTTATSKYANDIESIMCMYLKELKKYKPSGKILNLYADIIVELLKSELLPFTPQNPSFKKLTSLTSDISLNPHKNWKLKIEAKKFATSQTSLNNLFKKFYFKTFKAFLLNERMNYAHKLLSEGLNNQKVSTLIGYKSSFAFSKAFKKFFGVSPVNIPNDF